MRRASVPCALVVAALSFPLSSAQARPGLAPSSEASAPEAQARAYLQSGGASLARGAQLRIERIRTSPIGTHVFFQQHLGDLPVFDAYVGVSLDPSGEVLTAWSTTRPAIGGPIQVSREAALSTARRAAQVLEDGVFEPSVSLGIGEAGPTCRVELRAVEPAGVWRVEVDARSGRVTGEIRDVAFHADGSGQTFLVSASVAVHSNALKDEKDAATAVPTTAYVTAALKELDGTGYLVGPYANLKDRVPRNKRAMSRSLVFTYDREDDRFESVQAYWALDYAQRYIQSLGFDDVNNRTLMVAVGTSPADNSFYTAGSITFGAGGVDDAEDSEIIWHEMGHAIQDDQVPGFGVGNEAGSMGEGFGDYVGASIGSLFSDGWQDECVGEWDAVSYSNTNPPCLRRVDEAKTYPDDMVGEVHADGEIWSAALWDCREVLGNDRALSVTLASHFLLSPSASFEEGAEAYLLAATELGVSRTELSALEAAFIARGIL